MSIKVIAILVESGRAFVEENNVLYHIKPPYNLESKTSVGKKDFELATKGYGFIHCDINFNSYEDLEKELIKRYEDYRVIYGNSKRNIPDIEILHRLPKPFIKTFVSNLKEKLEKKEYRTSINLGNELLKNIYINELPKIKRELTDIIKKADKQIEAQIHFETKIFTNISTSMEYLEEVKYSKLVNRVDLVVEY